MSMPRADDPVPGAIYTPMDYKTYALLGVTDEDGCIVLRRWPYCPSQKEIDDRITTGKKSYVQFAMVNVVGLISTQKQGK